MGKRIISGEYCGLNSRLKGERALLMNADMNILTIDNERPAVLAQFDNLDLDIASGWHKFLRKDFTNFHTL